MHSLSSLFIHALALLTYTGALGQPTIKVACMGNSITEGAGLKQSYTQNLQLLLGKKYEVRH